MMCCTKQTNKIYFWAAIVVYVIGFIMTLIPVLFNIERPIAFLIDACALSMLCADTLLLLITATSVCVIPEPDSPDSPDSPVEEDMSETELV